MSEYMGSGGSTGGGSSSGGGSSTSGISASGVGGVVGDFGSAVADFMSIGSDKASAAMYGQAAAIAGENVDIERGSLLTQTSQALRMFNQTEGTSLAQMAAAGIGGGSTSQDIRAMNTQQYGINVAGITQQNYIQQQAYKEQQMADLQLQQQEEAKARGAMVGGIFSTVAGIASIAAMA